MAGILHVIDTTGPGGAETIFIELADRLRSRGHRSVTLIHGPGWVEQELRRRGLEPLLVSAKGSFNIIFLIRLLLIVRRHKVELIQSHLLGANVYCAMVGMLTGLPVVATYHGKVDVTGSERFQKFKLATMRRGVSRYVAVSTKLASEIAEHNLLETARTDVIYNGIDLPRYHQKKHRRLRESLGIPDSAILAGCLGNIRPAKAYDVLIDALSDYCARPDAKDIYVAIAGQSGSLMAGLEAQAKRCGVDKRLHFIGFCENTPEFLAGIDLYLMCSRSEGFSLSTVEALAANLPILCTRCGGPEEILDETKAVMVQADSSSAFADGLSRILGEGEDIPDWSDQAAAAERFSMESMVNNYLAMYRRLGIDA